MLANRIEADVSALQEKLVQENQTKNGFSTEMQRLRDEVDNAHEDLASLGNCTNAEKKRLRALIDQNKSDLKRINEELDKGQRTMQQTKAELERWQSSFKKEMEDIRKMHGLGAFFRNLCGGAQ
eukprot:TRINITY_DN109766_c0_g1_i1.p3 TRINITY_DN109766_c0_g1~~TRINITY_DN109766_c0_g1_i1.p3  ORF type:complete len:124 (+),score=38.95 TRINITY_DN109766_c0_g1_i1:372-743(+)